MTHVAVGRYAHFPMTTSRLPLRAVAFDLDGTLADSAPGICSTFTTVLSEAGPPLRRSPMSPPDRASARRHHGPIRARRLGRDLEALVVPYRSIYTSTVVPTTLLFPRAWSLLRACRAAGLELAIVTGKTTDVAEAVLRRCRIRACSPRSSATSGPSRPKPYPDLMHIALTSSDCPPRRRCSWAMAPTTSRWGAAPASAPAVSPGAFTPSNLAAAGADHVVHSMAELRDLILGPPALAATTIVSGTR